MREHTWFIGSGGWTHTRHTRHQSAWTTILQKAPCAHTQLIRLRCCASCHKSPMCVLCATHHTENSNDALFPKKLYVHTPNRSDSVAALHVAILLCAHAPHVKFLVLHVYTPHVRFQWSLLQKSPRKETIFCKRDLYLTREIPMMHYPHMEWLRLVGSLKSYVSFAGYRFLL